MIRRHLNIESLKQFRQFVDSELHETDWVFRGEPKRHDAMLPKIDRITNRSSPAEAVKFISYPDLKACLSIERRAMATFFKNAAGSVSQLEASFLGDWSSLQMLMRHHGGPTRLLDWTRDYRVALFWACYSNQEGLDQDGEIYAFRSGKQSSFAHEEFDQFTSAWRQVIRYKEGFPVPRLLDYEWTKGSPQYVVPLERGGLQFPRMIVQKGLFTMASHPWLDHWDQIKR